jgi:hypothetical protein
MSLQLQLATKIEEFDIKFDPDLAAQFIIDNYGISEDQIKSLLITEGTLYGQPTLDITRLEVCTIQILTFEDAKLAQEEYHLYFDREKRERDAVINSSIYNDLSGYDGNGFENNLFYSFHN